jgi:hypothetical protein
MEKNPYKFSETNPRMVIDADRDMKVYYATAAMFLFSMHVYNRKFFRKDANVLNMMAFCGASLPAAYGYSDFVFGSAVTEAAILNNENESKH